MQARLIESHCVVDTDGRVSNLQKTLERGLPVCALLPERKGTIAIVGSGPSVRDLLDEIKGYDEIWAINGAYDYLISQGIVPTGFLAIDPLPGLVDYVRDPQPGTRFYIASPCDQSVFDALDGYDVWIWHPYAEEMKYPKGSWVVGGGTGAITRAPYLAHMLGWRSIHIYGADSSFNGSQYCYDWGRYKCDIANPVMRVAINGEGPFDTEINLMKQVAQLIVIKDEFGDAVQFRGEGLLAAALRAPVMGYEGLDIEDAGAYSG